MTYTDRSESATRPHGAIGDGFEHRAIYTPDGIVEAVIWRGAQCWLNYCHAGRRHQRVFDRPYSHRRMVTLAARFAAEVVGGERAQAGVEILRLVALAGALGYDLTLSASAGDDPPHVGIVDPHGLLDEALYSGDLAGARRWLEEAAAKYHGGGA